MLLRVCMCVYVHVCVYLYWNIRVCADIYVCVLKVSGIQGPSARSAHVAVWDRNARNVILFGGSLGQHMLNDCWYVYEFV